MGGVCFIEGGFNEKEREREPVGSNMFAPWTLKKMW